MKPPTIIKHNEVTITVGDQLTQGDLCDIYRCTYSKPKPEVVHDGKPRTWYDRLLEDDDEYQGTIAIPAVLKIVHSLSEVDLVENEAAVLTHLFPPDAKDEKFYRYLPHLLCSLKLEDRWQVNVMPYMEGYISWQDILQAYPSGIDYRDLAWMLKRVLAGIGFVHQRFPYPNHVTHTAIIPQHILVHPVGHGAKIIDWSYAVMTKSSAKAYVFEGAPYYPPEIFAKQFPTAATDIYMVAKCCVALLGGDITTNQMPDRVPASIQDLLRKCLDKSPSKRPQNAWDLHDEFDQILLREVGRPKYRLFEMPVT